MYGFKNYQTWNITLWLDNDEGMNRKAYSIVRRARSVYDAGKALQEWIEEQNPVADQASMWNDLMGYALGEVDWQEIASHYIEDEQEEEGDEDDSSRV